MRNSHLVAIPCKLAPGLFSSERVFTVQLANGEPYKGIAPRHFCWNEYGQLVGENGPGQQAAGMVAAKFVEDLEGDQVAVQVPDGEVVAVVKASVRSRPTEIRPPNAQSPMES